MNEAATINLQNQKEYLNQQWMSKMGEYTALRQQANVNEEQAMSVLHEIEDIQNQLYAISLALESIQTYEQNNNSNLGR